MSTTDENREADDLAARVAAIEAAHAETKARENRELAVTNLSCQIAGAAA